MKFSTFVQFQNIQNIIWLEVLLCIYDVTMPMFLQYRISKSFVLFFQLCHSQSERDADPPVGIRVAFGCFFTLIAVCIQHLIFDIFKKSVEFRWVLLQNRNILRRIFQNFWNVSDKLSDWLTLDGGWVISMGSEARGEGNFNPMIPKR